MRGLIYGDVCGSIYEWKPVEEQEKITEPLHFTDDTVLGAAVADALVTCRELNVEDDEGILRLITQKLREYGRRYPEAGYSRSFRAWMESDEPKPYGSKTNGAIMRCAAAGWLARSPEEARRLGRLTAMPTHNHPEAMDAAALTAEIIYRLRMGEPVSGMYALVSEHYVIPRLEEIRPITEFDFTCKTTLPIAFAAFYEAVAERCVCFDFGGYNSGYEVIKEAVKNAISLGGDTDTNAAIAAEFAEAWNYSWGFTADDMPYHGKALWYEKKWDETERCCTPDILSVIRRMDEAVAKISPIHTCGEYVYRTNECGEAVILKYPKTYEKWKEISPVCRPLGKVVEVPKELDGHPVTAIAAFAFATSNQYKGIRWSCKLPDGVRTIGEYAFASTREWIQLPTSVEAIGCHAFRHSAGVGGRLPGKLKVLGAYAFEDVKSLPKLSDGMELEYIGEKAMPHEGWVSNIHFEKNECIIPGSVKHMAPHALGTVNTVFWVYRGSVGEAFCRQNGCEYFYLDPELVDDERARWQAQLDRSREERSRRTAEGRKSQDLAERSRREKEEYDLVEVNVQRYAGWREQYCGPYYYIDQDERVYERRPKR